MEQVQFFSTLSHSSLQDKINGFLSENKDCISVKDIKYTYNPDAKAPTHSWSAMIRFEKL